MNKTLLIIAAVAVVVIYFMWKRKAQAQQIASNTPQQATTQAVAANAPTTSGSVSINNTTEQVTTVPMTWGLSNTGYLELGSNNESYGSSDYITPVSDVTIINPASNSTASFNA